MFPRHYLDDRVAGQPFEVMHDKRPQDAFQGVVALSALRMACGGFLQILVGRGEDFRIVVEGLTDRAVSVALAAYDLRQPIVIGLKPQHSFLFSTHLGD
jgi:hypothetical protein